MDNAMQQRPFVRSSNKARLAFLSFLHGSPLLLCELVLIQMTSSGNEKTFFCGERLHEHFRETDQRIIDV